MIVGNFLFLFLIVNVVRTRRQVELGMACMLLTTLVIGILTIQQFHQPKAVVEDQKLYMGAGALTTANRFDMVIYDGVPGTPSGERRAIGATSHPAVCAINLLLTLPFYAYFCRFGRMWLIRWGAAAATVVVCYNVILTNTRAAIVTMAVVVSLIFLTGLIRFRPRFLFGAIAVATLVLVANPADVWRRALDFSRYSSGVSEVKERVMMWHAALETIGDNWILGHGVGNQREAALRVRRSTIISSHNDVTSAHNDALAILLETGVGGFLIIAAFLFSLHERCRAVERLLGARGDEPGYFLATAARITIYTVLLFGVQVEALSLPLKAFWLAMGLVISHADQVFQGLSMGTFNGAKR